MKTIVITGSTRGIGRGLADEFLKRSSRVVVSGRTPAAVEKAVGELNHDKARIFGVACDVADFDQVQNLWHEAKNHFGRVDVWINNAGISNPYLKLVELQPEIIKSVVDTNLTGSLYGSLVAVRGMSAQDGGGFLYNMEGFGSDGRTMEGLTPYGSTKYAIRFLHKSLLKEAKDTSVKICTISPGIVLTDLWEELYEGQPEKFERAKRIVNILGDKVETVAPFLAEKVLANTANNAKIAWLTTGKAFFRFATAAFNKRDLFAE